MNSFLFANKWINKENKLRVRTIFKNIYWLQTRKLIRIVSNYIKTKYI